MTGTNYICMYMEAALPVVDAHRVHTEGFAKAVQNRLTEKQVILGLLRNATWQPLHATVHLATFVSSRVPGVVLLHDSVWGGSVPVPRTPSATVFRDIRERIPFPATWPCKAVYLCQTEDGDVHGLWLEERQDGGLPYMREADADSTSLAVHAFGSSVHVQSRNPECALTVHGGEP
jgi:hypothetical protein